MKAKEKAAFHKGNAFAFFYVGCGLLGSWFGDYPFTYADLPIGILVAFALAAVFAAMAYIRSSEKRGEP